MWMLLHGFTGSPRSWDRVAAALPTDESPHRPAIIGHGLDWERDRVESFDAEVDRLARLAETMSAPRYVCGYSMGARLALAMAVRGTPRLDGLVLIGAHPGLSNPADRDRRRSEDAARAERLRQEGTTRFVDAWEASPLFASQQVLPRDVLADQRAIRLTHDAEGLATALEVAGLGAMPCLASSLSTIDPVPIWVVGGRDAKFLNIAEGLAVELRTVEGAGHNVVLERPDEVVSIMMTLEQTSHG